MAIAEHSKMGFEEACYKQHIFLNHTFDLISDDISSLLSDRMSTKMKLKIDSTNLRLLQIKNYREIEFTCEQTDLVFLLAGQFELPI